MRSKVIFALLLIALITRLVMLDARPMDHDESIHAYLSYELLKFKSYRYDPAYHGPFLYFSTALLFYIFGDSEFVSRLLPVLFSIIGIVSAYSFKRWIGTGAYIFSFIMIFSTSILYYSRYLRNDLILVSSFLVVLYCYLRFLETGKGKFAYICALFLSIMFTSKENSYIYFFIFASFFLLYALKNQGLTFVKEIFNAKNLKILLISSIIFFTIYISLYSAFFSDLDGVKRAVLGSISHWLRMHEINDHAKPWYYYPLLLFQYEFLSLALALASIPMFYKRIRDEKITTIELFAIYWVVLTIIIYQTLSHKVPWLLVHLVTPLAFFGSIYTGGKLQKLNFKFAFLIAATATIIMASYITYYNYNDANEDLIYIQIQPSTLDLVKVIKEKIKTQKGAIFEPDHDYWPLPWYLRNVNIDYPSNGDLSKYDFIVTSEKFVDYCESFGFKVVGKYESRPWVYLFLMEKVKN